MNAILNSPIRPFAHSPIRPFAHILIPRKWIWFVVSSKKILVESQQFLM